MKKRLEIDEDIKLELLSLKHREALFSLVDLNRQYLRKWLPWLDQNTSPEDTEKFLEIAMAQCQAGEGPQYAIFYRSSMCGVCGFHKIDKPNQIGSIGYWIGEQYSGKGIMTRSVRQLLSIGFEKYKLNKVEIRCATGNTKSRSVPKRLGFNLDGVLRHSECRDGAFIDHAVYSMLESEYIPTE